MVGQREQEEEEYDDLGFWEKIVQPICAEFTGTFFLAYASAMCVTSTAVLPICIAQGFVTAALCIAFINISGGHLNPCVTLSVWLSGGMKILPFILYLPSQFLGALVGAVFVRASVLENSFNEIFGGASKFRGNRMISPYNEWELINTWDTTPVLGLIINVIVSIVIFTTYLQCNIDNRRPVKLPIMYGFAITACSLATYVTSGAGFNPVVSLCNGMLAGYFDDLYVYIVAPICGCLLSAAFFRLLLGDEDKRFFGK